MPGERAKGGGHGKALESSLFFHLVILWPPLKIPLWIPAALRASCRDLGLCPWSAVSQQNGCEPS